MQAAIEAGAEPVALVDSLNLAQADKAAAEAELANMAEPTALDRASVEKLARLYRNVQLVSCARNPVKI
ncbi:hypothetical protein [Amycolatopsis samaneae]|uniref:Uncharacterized protein n=1 Tax=Amycolatopsis samaneae TaxID=664691 RepID=A0ABW5GWH5_9PSEU